MGRPLRNIQHICFTNTKINEYATKAAKNEVFSEMQLKLKYTIFGFHNFVPTILIYQRSTISHLSITD